MEHTVPGDAGLESRPGKPRALMVADAIYLLLVFGWMLALTPLGRDYAAMADPDLLGPVPGRLFSGMTYLFGSHAFLYYLANLLLLYLCMALILALTRVLGNSPWWLGSVAAVLFMANPVKTEAVLSLGGIQHLLPCLCGLTVLLVYAVYRKEHGLLSQWLPPLAYIASILICPDTIPLFLVLVVMEACFFRGVPGGRKRLWLITGVGLVAFLISGQWAFEGALQPANMVMPLLLILYPIGLLPDTVAFFGAWPVLGWTCALCLAVLAVYLMRRANDPLFTFGLLGAVAFRLLQGGRTVDPVTLSGGGALLIPTALFALSVGAAFHTMMRHPRWRSTVVRNSTLLCVVVMLCQGWVNWHWLQAGRDVGRFQKASAETAAQHPGQPLAVVPDLQYVSTAPVMQTRSVRYHTPFSTALPVVPLMPLSVLSPASVEVLSYSAEKAVISVSGLATPTVNPLPRFSRAWWKQRHQPQGPVTLELEAGAHPFPEVRIPLHESKWVRTR